MKTTPKQFSFVLGLAGLLALGACSTENEATDNLTLDSTESAEVNTEAENEFTTVFEFVDDEGADLGVATMGGRYASNERRAKGYNLPDCGTRTWDAETRTMTIEFAAQDSSNQGCQCEDGRTRSGQIVATFSGNQWRTAGSQATISLNNYFVNGYQRTGTKVVNNQGLVNDQYVYSWAVSNASIETAAGTFSWQSAYTITRVAGNGTKTPVDDVLELTGGASGTNRQGGSYSMDITQPLKRLRQRGCARTFVSGQYQITNSNGGQLQVNYDPTGEELCDWAAQVTVNGESKIISLR